MTNLSDLIITLLLLVIDEWLLIGRGGPPKAGGLSPKATALPTDNFCFNHFLPCPDLSCLSLFLVLYI